MSYNEPRIFVEKIIDVGEEKIFINPRILMIRAFMAGAILAIAAVFAITVGVQTGFPIVGAVLFPVGFCMLYLMGFDLVTGIFVLAPLAWLDRRPHVTLRGVAKAITITFIGNFLGALLVAFLTSVIFTYGFSAPVNHVGEVIANIGKNRTVGYKEHGMGGMMTIFIRGVLCNWMVSLGVVGAMVSTSVSGKVIAMWMPIMLFFAMTFEHSVVNMYLFPTALILGGDFSILDYLIWNEIPVVIGNLVGGLALTGLPLFAAHMRSADIKETYSRAPSVNTSAYERDML
ncbi:formate/nitrite transporter family protein [Pseudovibrio sp. WM33]|uniref:formate/nitrite transporter family protein n=1 Tax=Pseudovibrio sp. WM33 TaxID=1735585 RepID=UPI0007B20F8B|nr:formate/nitrite transporter family protein [Pseudovibrio sp. WM33]KZL27758.1 putative formate transporter 1 [Pseudovibrio sp. WM33]